MNMTNIIVTDDIRPDGGGAQIIDSVATCVITHKFHGYANQELMSFYREVNNILKHPPLFADQYSAKLHILFLTHYKYIQIPSVGGSGG